MTDLFGSAKKKPAAAPSAPKANSYTASDIEVLEGLEPVRRRPGMYIGGTDENAMHHLINEILDNSMDEAVAGHATRIDISLKADSTVVISDNGRGIPVEAHPKYPKKSALEVILTVLHSGGKFSDKAYQTSGGLHGVGISVVNALSDLLVVEVARDNVLYRQTYSRGAPTTKLETIGAVKGRRGTTVSFHPDPQIFGESLHFSPKRIHDLARSKAYLYRGVEIAWSCDPSLVPENANFEGNKVFKFPNGLLDYLSQAMEGESTLVADAFYAQGELADKMGKVECAITWLAEGEGFCRSYCNTIPTPQGGTHETGLRTMLVRGLKGYGEMIGNKKASIITADDVLGGAAIMLSLFIREPQFQGQTKDKLASAEATRLVDNAIKDYFDHWLTSDPNRSSSLLTALIEKAEDRQRRRDDKDMMRKTATRKLRLPGKLSDCARNNSEGTELFIVEGDSAGGSAKQGRNRETQAILPLRGKILNVVSATREKIRDNQEIQDLILAMGCGIGSSFALKNLRYERIVIMTDADVDGAHIASLLMTFFYTQMPEMVAKGHLYLAQPPLYRLTSGNVSVYAMNDQHKDELMKTTFKGKSKVEVSRFKGLGEMPAKQLKETTMAPESRTLIRVTLRDAQEAAEMMIGTPMNNPALDDLVEKLMGKNAEARFDFIQQNATFVDNIDV
ncbi:MAG: DNA topoisomerase IV subunit B [Alphaproteobacteria bacterium RIFCSPHIGHO2_12_FULL_45_9]|nr:MAG: DNA topoisomerase IV subunit B [Alphaproteobacteria bacterium RIFCSPHIGHO2_02_FULL_46_13]OFW93870.1 MAG: DNA topoisomerase IV subunit B [Alphaproteobacteria bacterium RIFCSPHIGHO2_12_FULL_45_9]